MIPHALPAAGSAPLAVDHVELPGSLVEHDRAAFAAHHDVLDPCPVAALQVDPGLDAEGGSRHERLGVPGDQIRVLVALEADAVAQPVDELRAEAAGRVGPSG